MDLELELMRKRKVIENFAEGFVSSFISRYNDIDGYWAMGNYLLMPFRKEPMWYQLIFFQKKCYLKAQSLNQHYIRGVRQ